MRKDMLSMFDSALFTTYESAAEQTSSEYDAHRYVRKALLHYIVTGETDKFAGEASRLNMRTNITREDVARHLSVFLYEHAINNEPRTRLETRFKKTIEGAERHGVSEAQMIQMLNECFLYKRDKFFEIGNDFIISSAIRAYETDTINRMLREQSAYDLDIAMQNDDRFGITSVKVNKEALNLCRQEIISGTQISRQNSINKNNARQGRIIQRPRREYSLDDELFAVSDIGMMREDQEDSVLILKHPSNPDYKMIVVADGVGGHYGGEKASYEAVLSMMGWFESINPMYFKEDKKRELVGMWNERLLALNKVIAEKYPGAGSTFVGAIVGEKSTLVASIGDSRAYLLDNNLDLRQVTIDDNIGFKNWEKRWGTIYRESRTGKSKVTIDTMLDDKDKVRFGNDSNIILSGLGLDDRIMPHFVSFPNYSYRTLLLLSDGVTDCLSDRELMAITKESTPKEIAKALVDVALVNDSYRQDLEDKPDYHPKIPGGKDNATAAVYLRKKGGNER